MANYPTSLDTLSNPTSTDLLENATATLDHDYQHATANDILEALEAKVGVNSSAVTTSHDYKLSAVTGTEKALTSGTSTQTVSGLTLTSPQINFGSDASGDLIYRNGSGVTARLAIGTTDQILAVQSGLPAWIANPSASAASSTTAGIVELATTAETTTGTDATRAVTPQGLHDMTSLSGAAWFLDEDTMASDSATKVPSQQSVKAYVDSRGGWKAGVTTKNISDADTTQTIAHGLGRTPVYVRITATRQVGTGSGFHQSVGSYNGTNQYSSFVGINNASDRSGTSSTYGVTLISSITTSGKSEGTVSVDGTNISIAWVKTNSPSSETFNIFWETI